MVEKSDIVLSLKAPKKNPTKPPKFATALIPFRTVAQAFEAIAASGTGVLKDIEVSWAEGKEPEAVRWLKETGQLSSESTNSSAPPTGAATFSATSFVSGSTRSSNADVKQVHL